VTKRLLILGVLGLGLNACATRIAEPLPGRVDVYTKHHKMRLSGAVIRAETDTLTKLKSYDDKILFDLAVDVSAQEDQARGRAIYVRLLGEFPESSLRIPALFNLGLLYEADSLFKEALEQYLEITDEPDPYDGANRQTWLDAYFRWAVCAAHMENWEDVAKAFQMLLAQPGLSDLEELEAGVGLGIAYQNQKLYEDAEIAFQEVLSWYREMKRYGAFNDRGFVAEAAFRLGQISAERFDLIVLAFPQEILKKSLELKCAFLLQAQDRYLKALRYGDIKTAALVGLGIGEMYEKLHEMVVELKAPQKLNAEQRAVYEEVVEERIRVLVKKALYVYERSLLVGRRDPAAEPWVKELEEAVARLRSAYRTLPDIEGKKDLAAGS